MDEREGGFIVIHRRIQSSPEWLALRGEQRSVFVSVLLLANWMPGYFWAGSEKVEVARGELAHAVETIAEHAAVTYAVARRTVEVLISRGVISVQARIGTRNGIRVLRVVNYEKYQDVAQAPRNQSENERAAPAQGSRNALATIEPTEPEEPKKHLTPAASPPNDPPPAFGLDAPRATGDLDRLRRAVSDGLGVVGAGGGGLPLGDGRKVGELIRNANAAIGRIGFAAVVEACIAEGRQARANGRAPETLTFFRSFLGALANPETSRAPPVAPRVTAPASSPANFTKGGPVAL